MLILPNSAGFPEIDVQESWSDSARQAAIEARKRAYQLLSQGKSASLPPKLAHKLLKKLHKEENVNLSRLSIGKRAIFKGGFNIPRDRMPQLKDLDAQGNKIDARKEFIDFLKSKGIDVSKVKKKASSLRPTQSEILSTRTSELIKDYNKKSRVFVSSDGFVLDGHHHWASAIGKDIRDGHIGGTRVKTYHINLPMRRLLPLTRGFTSRMGIRPKAGN